MPDPGGPWTRHGHPIPGVTVTGTHRPANVARCGGPALCRQCQYDVDTRTLVADVLARAGVPAEPTDPGVDACPHLGQCPTCSPGNYLCATTAGARLEDLPGVHVTTVTLPDNEVRRHPLHQVIADALRTGMAPGQPDVVRIWGRRDVEGWGPGVNVWAGTPADVADHLVRAVLDHLPTIDGRWVIAPTLEHLDDPLPTLTTTPPSSVLHNGDRISVADSDGKGVNGYVAGWTTAPGGHPFVLLCTIDRPGFPP